ncbi:MAG: ATP-binding protein [Clostridiales bacterium]|nr:ATP-binding protein [Clostridiales bacterium]
MNPQIRDKFYDEFLKEPTKDNFRDFIFKNCGELDEVDFKETWIDKGHLAKTMLAMANSMGGVIIIGIKEEDDGTLTPIGLETFKDKATVNNDIHRLIPASLDYQILDFSYNSSEYEKMQNKKFQMLIISDTPDRLPFVSQSETTGLDRDVIYIRRGTKCEKATASDIDQIISNRIEATFKEVSDMSLPEHLDQLKVLYTELPKQIKVLIKKGTPTEFAKALSGIGRFFTKTDDIYEERDNPNYPEESYEEFILKMIGKKKLKIEKVLDLK